MYELSVRICLEDIMRKRKIDFEELMDLTNLPAEMLYAYFNNEVDEVDLEALGLFCYVLDCGIGDILKFTK